LNVHGASDVRLRYRQPRHWAWPHCVWDYNSYWKAKKTPINRYWSNSRRTD